MAIENTIKDLCGEDALEECVGEMNKLDAIHKKAAEISKQMRTQKSQKKRAEKREDN